MQFKQCSTCKNIYPIEKFYRAGLTKGGKPRFSNECIRCRKQREHNRYIELFTELSKYKIECVHCGIRKPYLLEFHHRDPNAKEFTIGSWRKHNKELILKEISQCDTLCKNCHAEFHYLNKTIGISYKDYLDKY